MNLINQIRFLLEFVQDETKKNFIKLQILVFINSLLEMLTVYIIPVYILVKTVQVV